MTSTKRTCIVSSSTQDWLGPPPSLSIRTSGRKPICKLQTDNRLAFFSFLFVFSRNLFWLRKRFRPFYTFFRSLVCLSLFRLVGRVPSGLCRKVGVMELGSTVHWIGCRDSNEVMLMMTIRRRIFWLDTGASDSGSSISSIHSSKMTGTDRQLVVRADAANVRMVGLCTDVNRRRLYWAEPEYGTIATSDYDGNDVRRFPLPPSFASRVLSLSVGAVSAS